jgi:predicted RNase H-like HicB family nuclease
MKHLRNEAEKLAAHPYRIRVTPDETTDGRSVFLARIIELDGCVGHGSNVQEAIADVRKAMIDYIESLLEDNMPVPTPLDLLPVSISSGSSLPPISEVVQGDKKLEMRETVKPEYIVPATV